MLPLLIVGTIELTAYVSTDKQGNPKDGYPITCNVDENYYIRGCTLPKELLDKGYYYQGSKKSYENIHAILYRSNGIATDDAITPKYVLHRWVVKPQSSTIIVPVLPPQLNSNYQYVGKAVKPTSKDNLPVMNLTHKRGEVITDTVVDNHGKKKAIRIIYPY